jgi:phospholipase C
VIVAYDDSDGWYDHLMGQTRNGSQTSIDNLSGTGKCGTVSTALPGVIPKTLHASGRCGYGPRLPLLVVSPWARRNYVDHTVTDQTSILKLIEDIFLDGTRLGEGSFDEKAGSLTGMLNLSLSTPQNMRRVYLDSATGLVKSVVNK